MFEILPYILLYLFVPFIVLILIIVGIVAFFTNRNNKNNMDPSQMKPKTSAKDVFLNLGAFIGLYTLVGTLLNLLFTIIDAAYPKIVSGYNYTNSTSISWPVSILVVFFPVFMLLMWFLQKEYDREIGEHGSTVHKGLTYITLFISGLVIVSDLITIVYYFIDGQELTNSFLLKFVSLLVIASGLFIYFISDLRNKLTSSSRIIWRFIAGILIVGSIIWGFAVLGSPRIQRLYKYDEQKVTDLQNINNQVTNFYSNKGFLPKTIEELFTGSYYVPNKIDSQTEKPYEYQKTSETTYNVCAEFNKASDDKNNLNSNMLSVPYYGSTSWTHSSGHYCFTEAVNPSSYYYYNKPTPLNY